MRWALALLAGGLAISWSGAAPLPPSVEQITREGIPVRDKVEAKVQAVLKEPEGVHLFQLQKDQTYGFDLAGSEFKGRLRIEAVGQKMQPIVSEDGKATLRA